jgi:hypothetical protein
LVIDDGGRTINVMALVSEYMSVTVPPTTRATSLDGTWAVLANFALIEPFLPTGPKPPRSWATTTAASGRSNGVPSGVHKHLVERLTLDADGTRMAYQFELSDPEFLAAPVTGNAEWAYRPDLELALEVCDREAARRFTEE